jgi:phosphate transport system protein
VIKPLAGVVRMGKVAQQILKEVLDAISRRDAETAKVAWGRDSEVDEMYTSVFRELLTYMMEDPRNITPCTHLLFMAKNIERIGDHATNIAETVYYMVTGEPMRERRPKRDTTSFTDPAELGRPSERGGV